MATGGSLNDPGRGIDYFSYLVFVAGLIAIVGCLWAALTAEYFGIVYCLE